MCYSYQLLNVLYCDTDFTVFYIYDKMCGSFAFVCNSFVIQM